MLKNLEQQNKFNLYILEEGEVYIKEYIVELIENNQIKRQGILYFSSRSFIFESNDKEVAIEKYMFKFCNVCIIKNKDFHQTEKPTLITKFTKTISIPSINKPYETKNETILFEIILKYEDDIKPLEHVLKIVESAKTKKGFEADSLSILDLFYKFKFDYTNLKSIHEHCLLKQEIRVNKIIPLIEIPGVLMISSERIYFQPIYILNSKKSYSIIFTKIQHLYRRRIKLMEVGLEIIYSSSKSNEIKTLLVEFESSKIREHVFEVICSKLPEDIAVKAKDIINLSEVTSKWVSGEITNFDYLTILNSAANRTRNYLSQYPVFPWVLSDYSSFELDLNNPDVYRDLSIPIGKLTEKRFNSYKERYIDMPDPKYLYGTHFSTPAYTIGYLVRKYPQFMIKLQAGKYDHPDRLFTSMEIDWDINLHNPGSLKELIPEFYEENSDFLTNTMNLDLGVNKSINGNVELPRWAKNATHFLKIMREALDSDIVSSQLHNWIDLIFGYKQRGEYAIEADNRKYFNLLY